MLNIINLPARKDRLQLLKAELQQQGISEYRIWKGIVDEQSVLRGISQAHKQIVRAALDSNLPEVTIAEDDLQFTDQGAFKFFLNNQPKDYDLYLGGICYGLVSATNSVNDFSGLTLYTIRRSFYQTFLDLIENEHIDRALRDKGRYYVCNPFIVTQRNGYSDNVKKNVNYDYLMKNRRLFKS